MGDLSFDNLELVHFFNEKEVNKFYKDYFYLVSRAAKSGLFDVISHFDLINKSGYSLNNGYFEVAEKTLETIKSCDVVLEINTAGLRKERKEFYPSVRILKKAISLGIPLIIGSDAHSPEEVGEGFDKVIDFLKNNNVLYLVSFDKRKRVLYKIFE
ncbi:hypothetical protein DRQ09_05625 [candidate division KSB1 bacterium]|nr:MAG: hypothetical protein DRQ09_05625 [candidate division KSB1 bacterium]